MTSIEKALGAPDTRLALVKVLSENSFDSVLITDATRSGKIIYANKAFKTLTGYDPSDVVGKRRVCHLDMYKCISSLLILRSY